MTPVSQIYRASILHFVSDRAFDERAIRWHEDGLLLSENGHVRAVGDYAAMIDDLPEGPPMQDLRSMVIVPASIDSHVHYPQTDRIASPAEGLLPWLKDYMFPKERRFEQRSCGDEVAAFFLEEFLRNGTMTASIYCTVHPQSVEAFFTRALPVTCA